MGKRKALIAGNWKMNTTVVDGCQLAVDVSSACTDFTDREMHWENFPIFPPPLYFTAPTNNFGIAGSQIGMYIAVVLLAIGRRHQHPHVAADYLCACVAEGFFSSGVKNFYEASLIDDDERIDSRFDNAIEAPLSVIESLLQALRFRGLHR